MILERITVDPEQFGGAPGIRGLRIPVATVVAMVADGMTAEEILDDLPDLSREDIVAALQFGRGQLPALRLDPARVRNAGCRGGMRRAAAFGGK